MATDTGCGYKVSARRGKIKVTPTINTANCGFRIGIGNATFYIDLDNPPSQLTRVISGDAVGNLKNDSKFPPSRGARTFDSVEDESIVIQDANNNDVTINIKKLINFNENTKDGEFLASSYQNINEKSTGRIQW